MELGPGSLKVLLLRFRFALSPSHWRVARWTARLLRKETCVFSVAKRLSLSLTLLSAAPLAYTSAASWPAPFCVLGPTPPQGYSLALQQARCLSLVCVYTLLHTARRAMAAAPLPPEGHFYIFSQFLSPSGTPPRGFTTFCRHGGAPSPPFPITSCPVPRASDRIPEMATCEASGGCPHDGEEPGILGPGKTYPRSSRSLSSLRMSSARRCHFYRPRLSRSTGRGPFSHEGQSPPPTSFRL